MIGLLKLDPGPSWLAALLAVGPLALGLAGCAGDAPADDDTAAADDDTAPGDDDTTPGTTDCVDGLCVVTGTITEDTAWTADNKYLLRGGVFVGDDVNETVLTIEPGTEIYGETSTVGMLVVRRGSKLIAEGTADAPIVFTSSKSPGSRAPGDWGGLILNGRATLNSGEEAFGEGGTGWYGGQDDEDSSGVLRYVRVEFAGQLLSPDNELNGIAFQGVGRGTVIDHVQVHMTADDGIEFFGGTADFKHVLVTGIGDDGLDWTDGWRGRGQFLIVQQYDGLGDNGIEADNNAEDNEATPRSHPVLSHLTLIGSPDSAASDVGVLLREGTAANIHNALILGWNEVGLSIDHASTYANAWDGSGLTGELTISDSIAANATNFETDYDFEIPFTVEEFWTVLNTGNQVVADWNTVLNTAFDEATPDFRPAQGSPAASGGAVPNDGFFEAADFKGGVDPQDDWTAGWTTAARS